MKTTQSQGAHTPQYSETGPVWIAREYTETPECCDFPVTRWEVVDLDDHVLCRDIATASDAAALARTLNSHQSLVACRDALQRFMDLGTMNDQEAIDQARAALEAAR